MSLPTNPTLKKTPSSSTGATDSPYLGSKISLVSKAKIRYEGILYTIDANESTVALSKVRSFGTEDRPTDRPVHARDEIFEYIIFRGADIEDLQVREPPQSSFTHDPAIVESSMYPANARSNTVGNNLGGSSQTGQTRSSSNQGTMPSPPIQQGSNSKGHKLSSNADPLRQLNINQQQSSSRPYSQQSPAVQLDGQDFSYGGGGGGGQRRGPRQQRQDYYDDFNGNSRRNNQNYGYAEWPRVGNGGTGWDNNNWGNGYRQQQQQQQQQQRYSRPQPNFYPQRRFNNGQQANGYYGNDRGYGYRQRRNSTGGITGNDGQDGNQQQQQQQRGNRQHQQQHQQQQQQQQQQRERANSTRGNGNNSRTALKFIGDFDFEKSNAEFDKNAIEDEIKKSLSIKTTKGETTSDETPKSPSKTDASTPGTQQEKENQQSQQQQQQQQQQPISSSSQSEQELNPDGYYDKQKSFFDRISCEATEKERTNARRNWNEERRMNAETFGLKYRPVQQGGNQRGSQGGYYNNNRRNNNINGGGQQMYYGNGGRYPRGGGYGGQQQQQQQQQRGRGNGQGYGRNTMYYGNPNNRMRAY